ncbi:MAG: hypothetical protein KGR25_06305 [Chloroflexi bacterium]|nr:hypothetical protein [Chloroflexota bacterium]
MKNQNTFLMWSRRLLAMMAIVTILMGTATPALAEDDRDFEVVNKTSTPLTHLYVTYPWDPKLTDDLVPASGAIKIGASVPVTFATASSHCIYDVHAIGQNGVTWAATNIDLCQTASVTFTDQRVIVEAAGDDTDDEDDCGHECDDDAPDDETY